MNPVEISKVQDYLRRALDTDVISIQPPNKPNAPIEVYARDEFIGVLHRDEEDGEVSYDLHISVLAEDVN